MSFKWLSRRYGLQVNLAKQLLFAFVERHKAKVKATYLLAGWTKAEPSQHVVRLVDQESLLKSRELLTPVTSLHVYSIQPTQPKVLNPGFGARLTAFHPTAIDPRPLEDNRTILHCIILQKRWLEAVNAHLDHH